MSGRGSFVTQHIDCPKCFKAASEVLAVGIHGDLSGQTIGHHKVIAGFVRGLGPGDEAILFEHRLGPKLASKICHPLAVVIITDSGATLRMEVTSGETWPSAVALAPHSGEGQSDAG